MELIFEEMLLVQRTLARSNLKTAREILELYLKIKLLAAQVVQEVLWGISESPIYCRVVELKRMETCQLEIGCWKLMDAIYQRPVLNEQGKKHSHFIEVYEKPQQVYFSWESVNELIPQF